MKREGLRIIVVFEGRDAAGKGGTIKAITERVSPRPGLVEAQAGGERGALGIEGMEEMAGRINASGIM